MFGSLSVIFKVQVVDGAAQMRTVAICQAAADTTYRFRSWFNVFKRIAFLKSGVENRQATFETTNVFIYKIAAFVD